MRKHFDNIINMAIFAFVRSSLGVVNGPANTGHSLFLALTIQRWFNFVPETGDPETGSDSGKDHRSFIGLMSKTVLS